eukprot:9870045-Alexandrium_andersonii.AAC.1
MRGIPYKPPRQHPDQSRNPKQQVSKTQMLWDKPDRSSGEQGCTNDQNAYGHVCTAIDTALRWDPGKDEMCGL